MLPKGDWPQGTLMRTIIARMPEKNTFDPDTIHTMGRALHQICASLQIATPPDREIIATRIIDLARSGVRDAETFRNRVLTEAKTAE
jgi:hypothetical protein